jgi:hypothetical protein
MQTPNIIQARRPTGAAAHAAVIARVNFPPERRPRGGASHMLFGSPELAGSPIAYDRNAEIYGDCSRCWIPTRMSILGAGSR